MPTALLGEPGHDTVLRRYLPQYNCVGHRIVSKDLVIYGYEVYIRWSGKGFGDCNDVLFLPEEPLEYSILFAPSEKLPVVSVILYSKPDVFEDIRVFSVRDVKRFTKCLFGYAEFFARDVVVLDYIPRTKELLEELEEHSGPRRVVSTKIIYNSLVESSKRLCGKNNETVEEVTLGPEIEDIRRKNKVLYSIAGNLLYLHDGVNHVFINVRSVDPFEIGEENILIVYGIYGGRELAYSIYLGEEFPEEGHFEELVGKVESILREDGKLRSPETIAKRFHNLLSS